MFRMLLERSAQLSFYLSIFTRVCVCVRVLLYIRIPIVYIYMRLGMSYMSSANR